MKKDLAAVASRAGVHKSTVSRVLNQDPKARVSPETRERIIRISRELGYQPNSTAKNLSLKRTLTLSMLVPDVANSFFHEIIKGVDQGAAEKGYIMVLSHMNNREINNLHLRMVQEKRIDGIILDWAKQEDRLFEELDKSDIAYVLFNRTSDRTRNYIIVDDALGAAMAMEALIDLGHKQIAHLSGPLVSDNFLRRFKGYRKALLNHNLSFDNSMLEECEISYEAGREGMRKLLTKQGAFTAVFAANTLLAVGAMDEMHKAGLKIPEDVSIVGFHDAPMAQMVDPPLSVVSMPLYDLGRRAAHFLIKIIEQKTSDLPMILPPEGLLLRGSVSKPKD
jgi:LacI family transcriptional regulator